MHTCGAPQWQPLPPRNREVRGAALFLKGILANAKKEAGMRLSFCELISKKAQTFRRIFDFFAYRCHEKYIDFSMATECGVRLDGAGPRLWKEEGEEREGEEVETGSGAEPLRSAI